MKLFSSQPNYNEKFIHLKNAPIIESVIDFRIVSIAVPWDRGALKSQLVSRLSNYSKIEEGRELKFTVDANRPQHSLEDLGCVGFRAVSKDEFYITQFNQAGFALSRVKKYEDWESLCAEACNLWGIYCELLKPSAIKRIGIRFINRMPINYESKEFLSVFRDSPKIKQIADWELVNFLHRDVLRIPRTDYYVNLIKAIVSSPKKQNEVAAVLDSDVFYEKQLSCEWNDIERHLKMMHWAKNKVFFESINRKKVKDYK